MFIGEGPGKAEDLIGRPFVGPSGRLLRRAIRKLQLDMLEEHPMSNIPLAFQLYANIKDDTHLHKFRYDEVCRLTFGFHLVNLVCCHPTDGTGNRTPTEEEIGACLPRLMEQISVVNPKVIVCLGKVPYGVLHKKYPKCRHAHHPSYILRKGGIKMRGSFFMQWYGQLEEAVHEWKNMM